MICFTCHAPTPVLFFQGRRGVCADCQLPDTEAEAKPYVTPQPVENEDKLPLYVTPALPGARTPAAYEAEAGVTRKRMMWEELGYAE